MKQQQVEMIRTKIQLLTINLTYTILTGTINLETEQVTAVRSQNIGLQAANDEHGQCALLE